MKTIALAALLPAAFLAAAPAVAQSSADGRFAIGITGGTLGIGPEAAFRINPTVGVRANATFLSISPNFDSDDISYDGKLRLKSGGAMIDVFPFANGFRLSAGARINGNDGQAVATPTAPRRVGSMTFTPAQIGTLRGDADTRDFAPQLTLGYAGKMLPGLVFGVEAGALFQGRVRINRFTSSTGLIPAADLERERQELQDDVDDYKVYPILQLSVAYRF